MVRNGEENEGIFNNWSKNDHRIFNTKLWNCANKILATTQEEKFPNSKETQYNTNTNNEN